jgi:TolB-like protein/Tfp pilus assembly protein PilF
VDASLKDKLKCLVFIPVISRTYCDPKSFAWEHEFKAFVELASQDQFGLKVKLPNGNVASRALPVRIHDLDNADIKLCESILGGVLRGIEFIYKEPGVNKPLTADDDEKKNLNNTKYRIQINKVANAIKEIITSLGQHEQKPEVVQKEIPKQVSVTRKSNKIKIIVGSLILLALIVLGYFVVPKLFKPSEELEKSIAVLPFINDSPVDSNKYFINGIMEEVLNNLQKIKDFRVLSRTSTDQYKGSDRPTIPEIAKKLGVNYIVEGSGQKIGNTFRLRVQLLRAKGKETHLWAKSYGQEIQTTKDIFSIQSEIAQAITAEMKANMTPEEKHLIEKTPTASLTAYDFYQRGQDELTNYEIDNYNKAALEKAEELYQKALKYDSTFAQAYAGLARVYFKKHFFEQYFSKSFMDSVLILCNIALSVDNNLPEAYTIKGEYYADKGNINKAIDEYDKALKINTNFWEAYNGKGNLYFADDLVNSIDNYQKAASLNHGLELPVILRSISIEYSSGGFIDKAKYYNLEALKLDGDSVEYLDYLATFEYQWSNYEKAIEFLQKGYAMDSTNLDIVSDLGKSNMFLNQFKESLKYYKKYVEILKALGTFTNNDMHRIGWAYWENGYKKEGEDYFNKQLEYSKNDIELKRPWGQKLYPYYDMAGVYAFRGDKEKAYKNLRIFNQRKTESLWMVTLIKNDPLFNSIRNEPEFQQIVRDVEAKYQAEHERVRKWLEEQGML